MAARAIASYLLFVAVELKARAAAAYFVLG
jgi:hypothetical protein